MTVQRPSRRAVERSVFGTVRGPILVAVHGCILVAILVTVLLAILVAINRLRHCLTHGSDRAERSRCWSLPGFPQANHVTFCEGFSPNEKRWLPEERGLRPSR